MNQSNKTRPNTNNLSTKLTNRYHHELEFKAEAIKFIGIVLRARLYCVNKQIGCKIGLNIIQPVNAQYNAYKNKWKAIGVARFLVNYQFNLSVMITGGQHQQNKLTQLINQSKKIINEKV